MPSYIRNAYTDQTNKPYIYYNSITLPSEVRVMPDFSNSLVRIRDEEEGLFPKAINIPNHVNTTDFWSFSI